MVLLYGYREENIMKTFKAVLAVIQETRQMIISYRRSEHQCGR